MGTWRGVVGLLAVFVFYSPVILAQSDTEPPVLVDFDFNPKIVDVTAASAQVTFDLTLTDDSSGVAQMSCTIEPPSGTQIKRQSCQAYSPVSGDRNNGVFSCSMTIPQYTEEGTWRILHCTARDAVPNATGWDAADLQGLGLPTDLVVVSDEDIEPPVLVDFDFNPKIVDVTAASAQVTFDLTLTDDSSGVAQMSCTIEPPSGTQIKRQSCQAYSPVSGDRNNGVFSCSMTIPQYTEEGTWRILHCTARDAVPNATGWDAADLQGLGLPTDLVVVSDEDIEPPVLVDFDFNPKIVDVTAASAQVTFDLTLTDDSSGVAQMSCTIEPPSGTQIKRQSCQAYSPVSGDRNNGVFSCSMTIPQYTEEGTWRILHCTARDAVPNATGWDAADLQALGFPKDLTVGFLPGRPAAVISSPSDNRRIQGNSVTARARVVQGNPSDISLTLGVRLDYRALPFGDFAPIPARNANHPNPDVSYPYFIHWDLSEVPDGDYELRAVAHDLVGTPDPAPETITITIDHAGPADVEEYVNAEGLQENQTAVDSAAANRIGSGDHTDVSTATELTLPPGSLLYTTDTAKLVYPDAAAEEGQLEQAEQSIGAFVDLSLLSGQTDLEAGATGDLNISYSDANQDGVVDGTSIREVDLELRHLDTRTNSYVVVPSIVLTEHNMVHAEPGYLGKFALAGPLMPRMWVESDKETLTWDAVSTATSYVVYRGLISTLTDVDLDGVPDSGFGDCMTHLDGDPDDLVFVDPDDPGGGDGFYYLIGFVGPDGTAGLGNTSAGTRREPSVACP